MYSKKQRKIIQRKTIKIQKKTKGGANKVLFSKKIYGTLKKQQNYMKKLYEDDHSGLCDVPNGEFSDDVLEFTHFMNLNWYDNPKLETEVLSYFVEYIRKLDENGELYKLQYDEEGNKLPKEIFYDKLGRYILNTMQFEDLSPEQENKLLEEIKTILWYMLKYSKCDS